MFIVNSVDVKSTNVGIDNFVVGTSQQGERIGK
jgi:hypothetical protein